MAWPRTAYLSPPEVGKGVIEKSDVALLLDILEHYRRRLQGLKNEFEAERKNEGFFLEDIDNEISSTINLVNHRRRVDTVELNGLTTEEENLIVRAIEVFVDDASRLENDMKKDLPKVSIKSESLDRRISLAKQSWRRSEKKNRSDVLEHGLGPHINPRTVLQAHNDCHGCRSTGRCASRSR